LHVSTKQTITFEWKVIWIPNKNQSIPYRTAISKTILEGYSLMWPDFSRRALLIRDDKCPHEKGLVQFWYQTRSVTPNPSLECKLTFLSSVFNLHHTWLKFWKEVYAFWWIYTLSQLGLRLTERVWYWNWTRFFLHGRLSSLINNIPYKKGTGHVRLAVKHVLCQVQVFDSFM